MSNPRIVVFGYSEVGYVCLELLLQRGPNIVGLFTHLDNPGEKIWFRSVAALAKQHNVPVFTPESFKEPGAEETLRHLKPDLIFSFYYRRMIPERILQLAPLGAFNMHGSFLPKYRGKAPVNWAVLHGATQTGATLHQMVKRADAGDIVDQEAVPIGPEETAFEVMKKVQDAAVHVLDRQLDALLAGKAPRHPQDESQATCFGGRSPEDGRIDWRKPARDIFNLIRAVTRPFPGAFTDVGDARLMVWCAKPLVQSGSSGSESAHSLPRDPAPLNRPSVTFSPTGGEGQDEGTHQPGKIINLTPLLIATGNGLLEITESTWVQSGAPTVAAPAPPLVIGRVL